MARPYNMIRIAVTPEAYDAIKSTLAKGANEWPPQRNAHGNYYLWVPSLVVDRLGALRAKGEDWSHTIIRLAKMEATP